MVALVVLGACAGRARAQGAGFTTTPLGNFGNTNPGYPAAEGPEKAFDNIIFTPPSTASKYLNFGAPEYITGVVVTPAAGSSTVQGIRFSTANDAPGRDPLTFTLEGSTTGANGTFVPIFAGPTGLLTDPGRNTTAAAINFINNSPYTSYRITFPTIRATVPDNTNNSLQIAEIELLNAAGADVTAPADPVIAIHSVPEPAALSLLALGGVALWRRRK
jgi:MYXO-CTERM domain-containing protein